MNLKIQDNVVIFLAYTAAINVMPVVPIGIAMTTIAVIVLSHRGFDRYFSAVQILMLAIGIGIATMAGGSIFILPLFGWKILLLCGAVNAILNLGIALVYKGVHYAFY